MPARPRKRRGNKRQRRVWQSVAAMAGGLVLLTALGWLVAQARDTDRQDPTAGVTTMSAEEIPDDAPELRFQDVAEALGVEMMLGPGRRRRTLPEDTGSGLAWADYDGDGDFDLYLVNFAGGGESSPDEASNRLFRNDGARFVDVTQRAGVGDAAGFGMGATFADFDADGDQDLYVTNRGPNRLYTNSGNGTFIERAAELGLDDPDWSVGATWGDFDGDGRLDLYVGNYVDFDDALALEPAADDPNWSGVPIALNPNAFDPQANRLYRQDPSGHFFDDALAAGVSNPQGRSLGVAAIDVDDDGRLDLYVANDVSPNALYLNRSPTAGEAVFEDASARTGIADPRGSMGICVGDFGERTGSRFPTLLITHWVAQENALYQPTIGSTGQLEYRDRSRQRRLAEISIDRVGWGCAAADFDADGRPDLVIANGSTLESPKDPTQLVAQQLLLHWNAGDRFVDLSSVAGEPFANKHVARGLGLADFDGDGDLDLAIARNRASPLLLENQGPAGNTLGVRLLAPDSQTIGARIELVTAAGSQAAWWRADASFASDHASQQLFGLGEETSASRLCFAAFGTHRRCFGTLSSGRVYLLLPN